MIKFSKDGKKVMEMTDQGEVKVFDENLKGAGKLIKEKKENDKGDDKGK